MKKRIWGIFLGILCTAALTGCGGPQEEGTEDKKEKVELTVWGAEEDTELMNMLIKSFQAEYGNDADFQIAFEVQSESSCKDALIGGLEEGADVFTFEHRRRLRTRPSPP